MSQTIDTATARRMAEAGTIRGVSIVGQPGGWSVMLKTGTLEKPLGSQKADKPRTWRSLDTLTEYLRKVLSIVRIDGIDATHHSNAGTHRPGRPDAAARLKHAHEAAAYDMWFRAQVDAGITEADDPATQWIPHEEVMDKWAKRRAKLAEKVSKEARA